jgi:hypothetical protein
MLRFTTSSYKSTNTIVQLFIYLRAGFNSHWPITELARIQNNNIKTNARTKQKINKIESV